MCLVPKLFLMGDGDCPVLTPSSLVCRIDWPKLNVLHFKQEHRIPRRVTTEPPPEPPHPPHMSSVLGSGGDTNPFEGATSVGGLSFISLPRQPPQPPPPRLTQQPIPFRGSTKPHCAVKPSKIRDAEFGLHDATDNPAMIQ